MNIERNPKVSSLLSTVDEMLAGLRGAARHAAGWEGKGSRRLLSLSMGQGKRIGDRSHDLLQRITFNFPSVEAAAQRTNPVHAEAAQGQRKFRAGGLTGTGAIKDYVAVARNL